MNRSYSGSSAVAALLDFAIVVTQLSQRCRQLHLLTAAILPHEPTRQALVRPLIWDLTGRLGDRGTSSITPPLSSGRNPYFTHEGCSSVRTCRRRQIQWDERRGRRQGKDKFGWLDRGGKRGRRQCGGTVVHPANSGCPAFTSPPAPSCDNTARAPQSAVQDAPLFAQFWAARGPGRGGGR